MSRLSFSSAANDAGAVTPSHMVSDNHVDGRHVFARSLVGNRLLDANAGTKVPAELSEHELDAHILDLARLVKKAQDDGDPHGAKLWTKDLADAINSRSAAHQRRLNDEAWERMTETLDYFGYAGELARQRIEQEG